MINRDEANERDLGGARGCLIALLGTAVGVIVIIGVSLVV